MVTATRVADRDSRSKTMASEDPVFWLFLLVNLAKIISKMIISPPEEKPNPSKEFTKKNI